MHRFTLLRIWDNELTWDKELTLQEKSNLVNTRLFILQSAINSRTNISYGADREEGGMDAMMQAAVCNEVRGESLFIVKCNYPITADRLERECQTSPAVSQ